MSAAVGAQRELQLPVRMGIATGEAELRDGDYFGGVLNRAARAMAAGHGGQVLVAESTACYTVRVVEQQRCDGRTSAQVGRPQARRHTMS
jgi:class 3 adenylate cyclase